MNILYNTTAKKTVSNKENNANIGTGKGKFICVIALITVLTRVGDLTKFLFI